MSVFSDEEVVEHERFVFVYILHHAKFALQIVKKLSPLDQILYVHDVISGIHAAGPQTDGAFAY